MSHQSDSAPTKIPKRYGGAFNPRVSLTQAQPIYTTKLTKIENQSITMPIAAIVMAGILYTYSVTSIRAAKRNAQLHREADGGQLDMRKESLRRHGVLDPVDGTKGMQLFREAGVEAKAESEYLTEKKAKPLGTEQGEERASPRTQVESGLENYKGVGGSAAVKKFKEARGE